MTQYQLTHYVAPPPTPSPRPFEAVTIKSGGVISFTTEQPFTAAEYAAAIGCSVEEAQASIDQAIADGFVEAV